MAKTTRRKAITATLAGVGLAANPTAPVLPMPRTPKRPPEIQGSEPTHAEIDAWADWLRWQDYLETANQIEMAVTWNRAYPHLTSGASVPEPFAAILKIDDPRTLKISDEPFQSGYEDSLRTRAAELATLSLQKRNREEQSSVEAESEEPEPGRFEKSLSVCLRAIVEEGRDGPIGDRLRSDILSDLRAVIAFLDAPVAA